MRHRDGERALVVQHFGGARSRSQEFRELSLRMTHVGYREFDHVDRTWRRHRPAPIFVGFHQYRQNIETVAFRSSSFGAPEPFDLGEGGGVILVGADRSDVHWGPFQKRETVRASILSYSACEPMNFMKAICRTKSKAT